MPLPRKLRDLAAAHDLLGVDIETDFDGSTLRGTSNFYGLNGNPAWYNAASDRLDWFGTVRGRLGYTFDRTLIYATGGLAYAHVATAATSYFAPFPETTYAGSTSGVRIGFTVGGGVEYAISPNWSVKAEGLYYNLGSQSFVADPLAPHPPFTIAHRTSLSGEIARVGVNYKFDFLAPPAPVVAKY